MRKLNAVTTDPFDAFRDVAFRVEGLPDYGSSDRDALAHFQATGVAPEGHNADWAELVRTAVGRGARVLRLRLVSDPLSPYERFEIHAGYAAGMAAGEDIRLLRRDSFPGPVADFWAFDGEVIQMMHYGGNGEFIARETAAIDAEWEVRLGAALRAFERATPLGSFEPADG